MPGIGGNLRTTEPLTHGRRNIIARNLVRTQMPLDLAETDFVVGIRSSLEAHDVFMVIARFIAELLAHVDHRAHINGACSRRQLTYDLRRVGAALEMHGVGAAERTRVIHQGIVARADIIIGVVEHPTDKVIPAGRLLIDGARFKAFAEETAAR
jgi:hypothetical protein